MLKKQTTILIDQDIMNELKTHKGSWTYDTLEALGVKTPLVSGWFDELVNSDIEIECTLFERLIKTRNKKRPKKRKNRNFN